MPYFPRELAVTPADDDPVYAGFKKHFGDVGAENVRRDDAGNLWLIDMATADDDHE